MHIFKTQGECLTEVKTIHFKGKRNCHDSESVPGIWHRALGKGRGLFIEQLVWLDTKPWTLAEKKARLN